MQNWTARKRSVFDIETLIILNWIIWHRTVLTFKCVDKVYTLY